MLKLEAVRDSRIYLVGDTKLETLDKVMFKIYEDSELFVRKTNIDGIFKYGSIQLSDYCMGHKKGYIWSSRVSVMNKAFDIKLAEACYKKEGIPSYVTCAIDLDHLEPLLKGSEYEIDWEPHPYGDVDIHYNLKKVHNLG